ncbi:putative 1-phosphatidylinositol-3-phosphate 5-kinase FAB1D [Sesamum angolense]|uniref:1-phosphatidylinositol-3-phosphate 5-kinase FAB1D n=1 Tax=Sesamum angolense TaxID=2727404 RepID=A0AAE1WFT0_9LAMI|nr:putative 1-phosphatidylinositol-3-phosphate 5-kinase FAB1D [Sesamum angolense]
MPSISPTASLRSTESSVSSCSDISVDTNFDDRVYVEDSSTDSDLADSNALSKGHLEDSNSPVKLNGFHHIGSLVKHESGEVRNGDNFRTIRNAESVGTFEIQETDKSTERVSSSVEISGTSLLNNELDAEFWLPPEPEDKEDEITGSVANYDDDEDEYGDGVSWTKPSSLSSFGEEGSGSYKFKEQKLNAMNNVRNGKFMALPDIHEGQTMDPDGYVKVKCIATGLRTQRKVSVLELVDEPLSQVIKGLVFKKHAAHKHMPTKYKNPRLLLIHGSLDLSSGGLSSFESMQQEKDSLKSIVEMIEMCHPNVILVEKSVSRDIQESILANGMTLVYDMKLHRLERVARCIGSPILSTEIAIGKKLRQCDSFRIEKFVEEHAVAAEGGKRPSKTLLFLEGSSTRLGCTSHYLTPNPLAPGVILLLLLTGNLFGKLNCHQRYDSSHGNWLRMLFPQAQIWKRDLGIVRFTMDSYLSLELVDYGTHFTNSTTNSYRCKFNLGSFQRSKCDSILVTCSTQRQTCKVDPLEAGTIKINFDGAVLHKGCKVGIGGVARDSTGSVLAWFSRKYQGQVNGEIAEALAAREAIDLAIRHGWNRILIEGDCLNLINKLNSSEPDQSYTNPLVNNNRIAASLCSDLDFIHVSRNNNTIAHKLATRAGASLYSSHCFSPVEVDLFCPLEADFQF